MKARPATQAEHPEAEAGGRRAVLAGDMHEWLARIDREIDGILEAEVEDPWMRGAIGYHLGWADDQLAPLPPERRGATGKRLRPLLALLSFQSALRVREPGDESVDLDDVVGFAAAVELVHNFSLIHDDIQDGDRLRRGRPTLWSICGTAQALNVGDCIHALAYARVGRLQAQGVEQGVVGELVCALARATVDMTIGQRRDLAHEATLDVDAEMYTLMIAGKTAALMACATYGGALLALGDGGRAARRRTAGYADFGRELGLCFQIRDDVLGIWGGEEETGKPTGSDVRRRKKSLPIVLALSQAGSEARQRLAHLYSLSTELSADQEREVRLALERCDAATSSQRRAELHAQRALRALDESAAGVDGVEDNRFMATLRELAGSIAGTGGWKGDELLDDCVNRSTG